MGGQVVSQVAEASEAEWVARNTGVGSGAATGAAGGDRHGTNLLSPSYPHPPPRTSSRVTNCSGCWRGANAPSPPLLREERTAPLPIPRSMGTVLIALLRRGSWPCWESMLLRLSAWP